MTAQTTEPATEADAAAPRTVVAPPVSPSGLYAAADLANTPDDGRKYEVLEGALVVSPYARFIHQDWVQRISDALRVGVPDDVFVSPGGNVDAGTDAPVPDVLAVDRRVLREDATYAKPDDLHVVVEVLSPGQHGRDRLLKRDVYARIGVPVYWIVDPATSSVEVLRLADGAYDEAYAGTDLAEAARITWQS